MAIKILKEVEVIRIVATKISPMEVEAIRMAVIRIRDMDSRAIGRIPDMVDSMVISPIIRTRARTIRHRCAPLPIISAMVIFRKHSMC